MPKCGARMGEIAVRVAKAAEYSNAGTVEFLVDQDRNFYFLEMNTRCRWSIRSRNWSPGLDLVHLQCASLPERNCRSGRKTSVARTCDRVPHLCRGSGQQLLPVSRQITRLISPSGPGIRRDSGMYEGWTVPLEYDPLLAKLIGYGETREKAIDRLRRALNEYFVGGIKTNISAVPPNPDGS